MSNKIAVVGDIMLDKYTYGNTERKNPESPFPLLDVEKEEYKLGGAANVAANLASLNDQIDLIGMLGKDENGKVFEKLCEDNNIHLHVALNGFPTITKQRFIETTYKQQLLRVDYEQKYAMTKEYNDQILEFLKSLDPHYIVLSDYNKGLLNTDLVNDIKTYAKESDARILADVKPNNISYFQGIYLLKPNFKEFCQMIGKNIDNTDDMIKKYGKLFVKKNQFNLVVTRGSLGATLITQDGDCFTLPTQAQQIFDVTGAGDTFIATIALALSKGYNLNDAVKLGNKAAGVVVGKVSTATVSREELGI